MQFFSISLVSLLSSLSFHLLQVEYHSSHPVLRTSTMWRRSFGAHDMPLRCPSHVTPIMPLMTPPCHRIHLAQRDGWVTGTLRQTKENAETLSSGTFNSRVHGMIKNPYCPIRKMFGIFCAQMGFVSLYVFNLRVVFQEIHLNSRRFEDTHFGFDFSSEGAYLQLNSLFPGCTSLFKIFYIIRVKSLSRQTTQVGW